MNEEVNVFWFRRDLRLEDNAGLYHALKGDRPVLPLFIFDKQILDDLEDKHDRRVAFIRAALIEMQSVLKDLGSSLHVYYGYPEEIFKKLLTEFKVKRVFTNTDYEPYAKQRDNNIAQLLAQNNISFHEYKDQVIFEKDEVLKDDRSPYSVFSPYSRKWHSLLNEFYLMSFANEKYFSRFLKCAPRDIPSLEAIGFKPVDAIFPSSDLHEALIKTYDETRNFPGIEGTSRLGVHLRFGTISIRKLAAYSQRLNPAFLNELIWRDFYHMILWQFPAVGEGRSFKPEYDQIPWRNNEDEFSVWKEGLTGYPIVDAGMRELNETGFMHNRVRMIVASFLCKHLLIDWRWGEAYFASKLLDYDFASNNGGWQWASGSGCDAAPYFRIFNPYLQTKKFDPELKYVKKWVPEFQEFTYPQPIVEREFARKRCIEVFQKALRFMRA